MDIELVKKKKNSREANDNPNKAGPPIEVQMACDRKNPAYSLTGPL